MTGDSASPRVLREDGNGLCTLTLNRPDKLNALDNQAFAELEAHLASLESEGETIGCVVLKGAGRGFCAGADLAAIGQAPDKCWKPGIVERLANLPQLVIAAIHGTCFTGGLELALAADFIVADAGARFADTHGKWGFVGEWGMMQRLPRRISLSAAKRMMMTARVIDAGEALSLGLADLLAPAGELDAIVAQLAGQILANSWHTNFAAKRLLRETEGMNIAQALAHEQANAPGFAPDWQERVARFSKNRPPTQPTGRATMDQHIPARDIPVPTGISSEARAILTAPKRDFPGYPPVGDLDGWRQYAATVNAMIAAGMQARAALVDAECQTHDIAGVTVYDVRPGSLAANDPRVLLEIHGGAYIIGYGEACRAHAVAMAGDLGTAIWSVDYRSPPDHPFPAPLEDCLAVYRHLIESRGAANLIVSGASAGANLSAALMLRARDAGLPMPAGLILHTPHLDMTNGSDTLYTNRGLDMVLAGTDLTSISAVYAPGQDYRNPLLSPLFGDLSGFPPTLLSSGTRDLFLSDTVRMHAALRALDIDAELHVTEAASHGNFHGAPEEAHIQREVRKFIARCWNLPMG